METMTIATLQ